VLQLALSAGTPNMSVIAVLGGSTIADAKGGTAHMVEIARAAGILDVEVIKLKDGEGCLKAPEGRQRAAYIGRAPRLAYAEVARFDRGGHGLHRLEQRGNPLKVAPFAVELRQRLARCFDRLAYR
jgi:hypothetical protein